MRMKVFNSFLSISHGVSNISKSSCSTGGLIIIFRFPGPHCPRGDRLRIIIRPWEGIWSGWVRKTLDHETVVEVHLGNFWKNDLFKECHWRRNAREWLDYLPCVFGERLILECIFGSLLLHFERSNIVDRNVMIFSGNM